MAFSILVGLLAFGWTVWLVLLIRTRRTIAAFRELPNRAPDPTHWPRVSIVVPARNEEVQIGRALECLARLDYPDCEIIVVDDGSTDRTGEITREAAARHGRIRLVEAPPLPAGWLGKCHALQHGASLATGEWLVFTDADVRHAPGSIRFAVAMTEDLHADFLTLVPTLEAVGPAEQIILPLAVFLGLSAVNASRLRDPNTSQAVGGGAFNMVRTAAYWEAGGHDPIRLAVIDDVMLAIHLKMKGCTVGCADGRRLLRVRMYDSLSAVVRGLRKNAHAAMSSVRPVRALSGAAAVGAFVLPLPAFVAAALWGRGWAGAATGLLGAGLYVAASLALRQMGQLVEHRPAYDFAHPCGACILLFAGALSTFDALVRRKTRWRGRDYSGVPSKGLGREAILPPERKP